MYRKIEPRLFWEKCSYEDYFNEYPILLYNTQYQKIPITCCYMGGSYYHESSKWFTARQNLCEKLIFPYDLSNSVYFNIVNGIVITPNVNNLFSYTDNSNCNILYIVNENKEIIVKIEFTDLFIILTEIL